MAEVIKLLLTTPLMWVLYLTVIGIILLRSSRLRERRLKQGWYLVVAGVILQVLLSLTVIADLIAQPLVRFYDSPSQDVLKNLEAIVVLGGGARAGSRPAARRMACR